MDALADTFPDLLLACALLLAAMALGPVARRLYLPAPAAFLVVGIGAGAFDLLSIDRVSPLALEQFGVLALYAILFQGGLATGMGAWRREARPIIVLGLVGTAATAAGLAALAHYALGLSWALASLVAVALSPTDPAAVYATLRGGTVGARARTVLEGESGFNDPVGISLMVVVVAFLSSDDATVGDGIVRFVEELGIGVAGGIVGGLLVGWLLRRTHGVDDALRAVFVVTAAILIGAGTATVHGSGFLAVYLCGLLASDRWAAQDGRHHAVPASLAAVAEPMIFALLGAAFASKVGWDDVWVGVVLTVVTVIVVRPVAVVACLTGTGLGRRDALVVSIGGLKGAVPLLLAAYPALEALDASRRTEAIVLVATATSIVVQGLLLAAVGRRPRSTSGEPQELERSASDATMNARSRSEGRPSTT